MGEFKEKHARPSGWGLLETCYALSAGPQSSAQGSAA